MTRFAFAGKCGDLTASGFLRFDGLVVGAACEVAGVLAPSARPPPARRDASAILPTPSPHSSKKCRRVNSRSSNRVFGCLPWQGISSLLGHRFVEVENRP